MARLPRLPYSITLKTTAKFIIVDGNAYLHRAYHAIPRLTTSRGEPVNAIYGFVRFLLKILREHNPGYCAVCFDHPAPTFRHVEYPAYKAHRKKTDDDLILQMPIAREAAAALSLPVFEKAGFEADDIIATLARAAARDGVETIVVTGDKDALQLVSETITVYNESRSAYMRPDTVAEKYGLPPEQIVDYLALMGDASDNVPGLPGVGEKSALKLIKEHGSVEQLMEHLETLDGRLRAIVAANKDILLQSKRLVTLCDTVPLGMTWRDCAITPPDAPVLAAFLARYEFTGLAKAMGSGATAPREDFFDQLR